MNLDMVSLLKELNENYKNDYIKNINRELKNKKTIDIFSVPMYTEDIIIGGCPREITFKKFGFPTSDLDLYKIEKLKKDNFILCNAMNKFYEELYNKFSNDKTKMIGTTMEWEDDELIDENSNAFTMFRHNSYIYDLKTEKNIMFFHYLVNSDKEFKNNKEMVVTKLMPGIIATFKNNKNIEEIVVILKHSHSFEEKPVSFTVGDYLDSQVLIIDNQPTSFDINKYYEIIRKNIYEIDKCVKEKEFSKIKNKNRCNECMYKIFCETLL